MLSDLPASAQLAINAGLGIAAFLIGSIGYFKSKKTGGDEGGGDITVLGIEDVTNNRVMRKFLDAQQKQVEVLGRLTDTITLYIEHVIDADDEAKKKQEIHRLAMEEAERIRQRDREAEDRKRPAGGRTRQPEGGG